MKTAKKAIISIAIVIPVPIVIYLVSVSNSINMIRLTAIIPIVIIALPFIWIERKKIKGDIRSVELRKVSDFGDPIETIAVLEKNDVDMISAIFNKRAKLFFDDEFEYCGYAFYLDADKPVIMYPQKNNMQYVKIDENTWSVHLSSQEAEALDHIIRKYTKS